MSSFSTFLRRGLVSLLVLVLLSIWGHHSQAQVTATFPYSGSIVTWMVPAGVTSLTITAKGAQGGFYNDITPGLGAVITGVISVSGGQSLSILVGQQPTTLDGGGGGGSFVVTSGNAPLVISGGGGGASHYLPTNRDTRQGQTTPTGADGVYGGSGGSSGSGGGKGFGAGGGGGLLGDGGGSRLGDGGGGKAFVNGGDGGTGSGGISGGFGGGGGVYGSGYGGGGGGGYSGGGGGAAAPTVNDGSGGGGGSYNAGTSLTAVSGANTGNGLVTITYILPCSSFTAGLINDGPLTCAKISVKLTATGGLDGATYQFSSGTSQPSDPTSATATATQDGPYSVTVTNPGGCSATAITTVQSNTTAPSVTITPSATAVCAGQSATFTATPGLDSYRWSTPDGGALLTTASISVSVAGTYSLTVTNSSGCSATANASLTVNALPSLATVTQLAPVCPGQPATIRLTGLPEDAVLQVNYTIGGVAQPPVSITTSNASRGWVPADPIPFQTRPLTVADNGTPLTITSLVITGTGCSQTFNQSVNLTVNPAPTATLTASGTLTCAQTSVTLTAGGGTTYQFSGPGVVSQSSNTAVVSAGGLYSVTVTNSSGCSATASTGVISNTVAPSVSVNPSATTVCAGQSVTLQATPGLSSYRWSTGQTTASISVTATGAYSVTATGSNGCFATASASVTVKASLAPPTVLTQSGQAYPGGVASLTVSQNTGSVVLVVGGCPGGTITWAGGNATTLAVSTASLGTFTYPATCQQNGCTSPVGTATVVVAATTLSVSHLDADFFNLQTNIIVPYLQLNNEGTAPIPYGEITVRYWFTADDFAPLTNLSVYYAQLGFGKVKMKYVGLDQPRQGAFGYVEYSFDASAGNLAGGRDSGPIQNGIAKQDYSAFNESDDYSYASNRSYTKNPRITAYRNGVLVWGQEPTLVAPVQSLKVYTENKSLFTTTNTISTYLQVSNESNIRVNYGDLKVRYYFTADGTQPLNFFLDYAEVGNSNVRGQLVKINPPLANADTYLELSFVNLDKLYPLSNTGNIQYRIAKSDWSLFNQNNDFSFLSTAFPFVENNRVSVFLGGARVYGTAPGAGARLAAEDEVMPLRVTVLGNPVVGTSVSMRVEGAEGQPLRIALTDQAGRTVSERQLERAGADEQLSLETGHQSAGILLLQVSTPTQSRTVKVLKR